MNYPLLIAAGVVWISISLAMLSDAIRIRNWHSMLGWIVASVFICFFFVGQLFYANYFCTAKSHRTLAGCGLCVLLSRQA